VVEDDAVLGSVVCDLLEHAGYAPDGGAGVARIEAGGVDLVLLDLMLPDVDGLELCRRARLIESDVYLPIIMLTVLGETQRHAGFLAGADDYVAKPFDSGDLLDRVQVWLRTRERLRIAHLRLLEESAALRARGPTWSGRSPCAPRSLRESTRSSAPRWSSASKPCTRSTPARSSFASRRRWRPWASSPGASRTTSTTCSR
jgi:DNA-binding response OmpR family regulator